MNNGNTKSIGDYLHLYVGSPFVTSNSIGEVNVATIGFISKALAYNEYRRFKLVLRKLSSMTEEEMYDLMTIQHSNQIWVTPVFDKVEMVLLCESGGTSYGVDLKQLSPNVFLYLLSKGFDLFELIPSGLAIEKQ